MSAIRSGDYQINSWNCGNLPICFTSYWKFVHLNVYQNDITATSLSKDLPNGCIGGDQSFAFAYDGVYFQNREDERHEIKFTNGKLIISVGYPGGSCIGALDDVSLPPNIAISTPIPTDLILAQPSVSPTQSASSNDAIPPSLGFRTATYDGISSNCS